MNWSWQMVIVCKVRNFAAWCVSCALNTACRKYQEAEGGGD
jgi:hypothetical protein